ncbi:MAG: peptidoglycan DD-metalloendopeptidase family protein [Nocardioides sp.]
MAALAVASLLGGVAVAPSATADDKGKNKTRSSQKAEDLRKKKSEQLKRDQAKLEKEQGEAHEDLEHSSAALQQASAALGAANTQLDKAEAHLAATRGELAAAEALDQQMQLKLDEAIARLAQARKDLDQGHVKVAEQERELGQIIVGNYQTGDPALMGLSMVLTSQDPSELTGQLNSVQNVIDKEDATLSRLEASKVLLAVQEQQVEAAKDDVAEKRQAAAENLVKKQELERQAEAQELQVQNLVSLRAEAQTKAEEARQADLATLASLEKEEDRISDILRQRAEAARRRAAAAAAAANQSVGPVNSNGFLDYPVSGSVTSPYGWRQHPIYGYKSLHDGIDIGAGCGTPILAPSNGRVLQEYYQSAWGNRIIIDHGYHRGVGVATISNHLSGYAVSEGEWVKRGQVIGYVGNTGWSTGCHLHFTVMENGSPVDPMRWL